MADEPITTKSIQTQRLELIDKQGRICAVFSAEQGVPTFARYDGRGRILSWLTFFVDGAPDIRFFDQNGKDEQ